MPSGTAVPLIHSLSYWRIRPYPVASLYAFCYYETRMRLQVVPKERPMPTITLTVSEHTIAHARQAASVLHRPVDEVLSSLLTAALGNIQDAPTDMQAEL